MLFGLFLTVAGLSAAPIPPLFIQLEDPKISDKGNLVCKIAQTVYRESDNRADLRTYEKTLLGISPVNFSPEEGDLRQFLLADSIVDSREVLKEIVWRMDHAASQEECRLAQNDLSRLSPQMALSDPETYAEIVHFTPRTGYSEVGKTCGFEGQRWRTTILYALPYIDSSNAVFSKLANRFIELFNEQPKDLKSDFLENLAVTHGGSAFGSELKPLRSALESKRKELAPSAGQEEFAFTLKLITGGPETPLIQLDQNAARPLKFSGFNRTAISIVLNHSTQYVGKPFSPRAAHWVASFYDEYARHFPDQFSGPRLTLAENVLEKLGKDAAKETPALLQTKKRMERLMETALKGDENDSACEKAVKDRNVWFLKQHLSRIDKVITQIRTAAK